MKRTGTARWKKEGNDRQGSGADMLGHGFQEDGMNAPGRNPSTVARKEVAVGQEKSNNPMADAKYVAAMLANGAKYARYAALDERFTERMNRHAKILSELMERFPGEIHDWDSMIEVTERENQSLGYVEPVVGRDKATFYRLHMNDVEEYRKNGFVANKHLMTDDWNELNLIVPI